MIRPVALGLLVVAASAGAPSPVLAAPSSFDVSAAASKACGLSATSVAMTAADVNHAVTVSFSPTSVTAWCNAAGTLSVSSTRIQKGTTNTRKDYTLSVTGWGSAMTYTTKATLPPPTTKASTAALSTTLSFACSSGCTDAALGNNTSWSATVTLGLTPN